MTFAQNKRRQSLRTAAFRRSGGHGSRTRNRLPGTAFPVRPLAIRIPSDGATGVRGPMIAAMSPIGQGPSEVVRRSFRHFPAKHRTTMLCL